MEMKEKYRTKDLAESAVLIVKGQKLFCTEWEGFICWFIFEDLETCINLSDKYFYGELLLNARDLVETMKRLKNRVSINK